MVSPRDVLNRLQWAEEALDEVVVWYVHRGAPGDRKQARGADIEAIGRGFLSVRGRFGGTMVPYHRIVRIERDGAVCWQRPNAMA